MSTPYPQLANRARWSHPNVLSERLRERLLVSMGVLIPLVFALAISVEMPKPSLTNIILVLGLGAGVVAVVALVVSTRYTVTLTLLVLYLGLLDGPIKLESASRYASGIRDVLIIAIVLGMLVRLGLKRERLTLPPLSGWVLAFVAVVLVEALNPQTAGVLKVIGGYRQELEFIPFFFFGYLLMRNKRRFRELFLLLGVIALANGLVGAYQWRLSPSALSGWGTGYGERIAGNGLGQTGRTYVSEGVSHPRPPALGSDSGFGGGTGVLALPGLIALLAAGRLRRRWPVMLCCLGALLGIISSASRTSIVIALVTLVTFGLLWVIAGLGASRVLAGAVTVVFLATAGGALLVAADGSSVLARQATLVSPNVRQGTGLETEKEQAGDGKEKVLLDIPQELTHAPFGLGLGIAGSAGGFGGHEKVVIEEEKARGSSAYNMLTVEVGVPGLLLWLGLTLNVIVLGLARLRRIEDRELRIYLVAVLTAFIAFTVQGLAGTTLAVTPAGAYLWFAPGVLAYWLAGAGWSASASSPRGAVGMNAAGAADAVAA